MKLGTSFYKVVCAGVLATGVFAQPPHEELALAKSAIEGARRAGADRYAQSKFKAAEESLKVANLSLRRSYSQSLLVRSHSEAARRAATAVGEGYSAALEAVANKRAAHARADSLLLEVRRMLDATRRSIEGLPPDPATRLHLISADVLVGEGRLAIENGNYDQAISKVEGARDRLGRTSAAAASVVSSYANSEQGAMWRRWAAETILGSDAADSYAVIVDKISRACRLYHDGKLVKSYKADLGPNFMKDKLVAGDRATPEGKYRITGTTAPGGSHYYRALHLNYPNAEDLAHFREMKRKGLVSARAGIGGLIEIHGGGGRGKDWTAGCIALRNRDIDDLARYARPGTPVTIVGYQGDTGTLAAAATPAATLLTASMSTPIQTRQIRTKRIVKSKSPRLASRISKKRSVRTRG